MGNFFDHKLTHWFHSDALQQLDRAFLQELKALDQPLHQHLLDYRAGKFEKNPIGTSELIIAIAKILDPFLAEFFSIENAVLQTQTNILEQQPVFAFKKWYVQRRAKRRLSREEDLPNFEELNQWLMTVIAKKTDLELAITEYAVPFLEEPEQYKDNIEKITQWCIQAMKTQEGQAFVKGFSSFKLPQRTDFQRLIPIIPVKDDTLGREALPKEQIRHRDGFTLTDPRMTEREVLSETDYCIYCHDHDGDFCSKGFPEKKGDPAQGFKKNPLDNTLTGCPLDEKISEMHLLKREGYSLGALATIMIDNPMCPATGHRICNDCMKACIYQKQDPVNIPEVETRVLTDILDLPFGVEIYDLLTRWNPLRDAQWVTKPYNGLKTFIAGMGPAGFTLAHHLLMEGFAVVGTDGLKIEPLPNKLLNTPIKNFNDLKESLDERLILGFGGVAEYGITVRWDKNFLKLIYLTLLRRPHFQIFGGVRFGGTVTVEDLWTLGFDHTTIAVGAGLPKALSIPGSMARGMRQANDFLMALQLTGAGKKNSLANLQLRMPVVVIGGGLTGVDTATEAQTYYIAQVEKTLNRYETLCSNQNEAEVRAKFDEEALIILDEFIAHAKLVRTERARAKKSNKTPDLISLLHSWGGVTIAYRKRIQDSPAYISNHEELGKALEEGIYYLENAEPSAALLDEFQHTKNLVCRMSDGTEKTLPAKSILVATGAKLNIAYAFEHEGTFKRNGLQYQTYSETNKGFNPAHLPPHLKEGDFGAFTSYDDHKNRHVSFIGDTHPLFHGNVVKAIASAKYTYPKIVALFSGKQELHTHDYDAFKKHMQHQFSTYIKKIERRANNVIEMEIHAPMAVKRFKPGQFFRFQNYETFAPVINDTALQTEPLALSGFDANQETGSIKVMVLENGASSKICALLKPNDPIAFMGPTGVRSKMTEDKQTILVIGNQLSLAYIRAVGKTLREKDNHVIYLGAYQTKDELFCQAEIEACTDQIIWAVEKGETISSNRPQDMTLQTNTLDAFQHYVKQKTPLPLSNVDRITVIGSNTLLKDFQLLRTNELQHAFKPSVKIFAAVYSTMQCMMKGVCAQCLQWQIDPETGQRTKAVFACSWQDQPLELVEVDNLQERLKQNRTMEILSDAWLDYLLEI